MAARQQTDQDAVHDILLANDDLANFLANFFELLAGLNYPLIGGHNFILVQASVRERALSGARISIPPDASACRNRGSFPHRIGKVRNDVGHLFERFLGVRKL